ncbi:MAG TPA: SpoIIE family protein phosphatase [Thermomonospora sp.]|nr:SpoIIE family protein phosphatase [Thermomonospora sp.]
MIVTAGWNLAVDDPSRVHEAETTARAAAVAAGLSRADVAACELAAVELATNLVRYAREGRLLVNAFGPEPGMVQLLAVDRGPGIGDVPASMTDGFSTGRSLGGGLGACRRAAACFDLYSVPGQGTVVLVQIGTSAAGHGVRTGAVVTPHPAEAALGDGCAVIAGDDVLTLAVVDGLGHGVGAAEARHVAVEAVRHRPWTTPSELVAEMDATLRGTRGAAAAVARIEPRRGVVRFAGVGNLTAHLDLGGRAEALVSRPGVLGMGRRARPYDLDPMPWSAPASLVVCTDGVSTWDPARHAGASGHHPAITAALIWRDAWRGTDDAAVLVASVTLREGAP